jgi:hypothetical protein
LKRIGVGIEAVKDLVKPPFANYDIVVYFGCGLFSLPFMLHYSEIFLNGDQYTKSTLANKLARIDPALSDKFVVSLIATLTVLISVYILGQIIAYLGSEAIEKLMDSLFGKVSSTILRGSTDERDDFKKTTKHQINIGIAKHFGDGSWLSSSVRLMYHFPVMSAYFFIYNFEVFGYHRTRVSTKAMDAARLKLVNSPFSDIVIAPGTEWFKSLEAIVVNNNPVAAARMYNYLVIAGLFRSVCFIFLTAAWVEMLLASCSLVFNAPPGLLTFGHTGFIAHCLSYLAVSLLYIFCLFSYFKFQRRQAEEIIFAYVYTKDSSPAGQS